MAPQTESDRTPTTPEGTPGDVEGVTPDPGRAATEGTPERVDAAAGTPQTTDDTPVVELPFDINEVEDPQQRAWLLGRQAQMQAGVTKLVQQTRQRERELAAWADRQAKLEAEETRLDALAELAAQYGVELDFGTDDDDDELSAYLAEGDDDETEPTPTVPPEVQQRLDALEATEEARQTAAWEGEHRAHLTEHLDAFAQQQGYKSLSDIPEDDQADIVALANVIPRLDNGFLNIEEALVTFQARQTARAERLRKQYLGSKDTPLVTIGGTSADPAVDLTDPAQRLKAAQAIAARHA